MLAYIGDKETIVAVAATRNLKHLVPFNNFQDLYLKALQKDNKKVKLAVAEDMGVILHSFDKNSISLSKSLRD